ncbi:hypothetical protein [Sphingomonas sp. TZW2008]|uniref:hypothetical protein n=1 Tax=Sphingomonas sp. TZW2008 TaxID=1917973 RepID=UPI000A26F6F8|nr:hypothetical protein [Sphingomonas sp. TZW2008]
MSRIDTATVPGWGVDADPENDPGYPMRHSEEMETRGLNWQRPAVQDPGVEVLQSIEHNRRPAVTGTSSPPTGLSGIIRRAAFKRSESDWFHWLMLMGADRVSVAEGVVDDLKQGRVPNVPAEMGVRAEWQHNKKGLVLKSAAGVAVGALLVAALRRKGAASSP